MKNVLYYHAYLTDDPAVWSSVILEQMKCMEDAELLSNLSEIRMTCITQLDARNEYIAQLCRTYPVKFSIELIENTYSTDREMLSGLNSDRTITENYTYRKIYNDCQKEDMRVCYIHTKGITSGMKISRDTIQQHKNYYYWRQYLNWGVIEKWKACISALQDHDVAGVNYYTKPSKHFSGNFWWANSSYINSLPDPSTIDWWRKLQRETNDQWLKFASDRFRDEQWLCSSDTVKVYEVHKLNQAENPAATFLPRRRYDNEVY
jgi:hypothetical protein